jgi:hypothetical protein
LTKTQNHYNIITMKTFDDLVFKDHPYTAGGLMCQLNLGEKPNDYVISVVTMKGERPLVGGCYGSQLEGTYEIAVIGRGGQIRLQECDTVLAGQTAEEITAIMKTIQEGKGASLNQPVPVW